MAPFAAGGPNEVARRAPDISQMSPEERAAKQRAAQVKKLAPQVCLELLPLSGEFDYRRSLASGDVDLVIGNWLEPPGELHLGRLTSDEVVCLVADDHPVLLLEPDAGSQPGDRIA